jgi:hypothetical protein
MFHVLEAVFANDANNIACLMRQHLIHLCKAGSSEMDVGVRHRKSPFGFLPDQTTPQRGIFEI